MGRTSARLATRDRIQMRTVAERDTVRRRRAVRNLAAENLNERTTVTCLTEMAEIWMMTATISSTERRVEASTAKQSTAHGYSDEIRTPALVVSLETRPPHYRNAWTIWGVVVTPM